MNQDSAFQKESYSTVIKRRKRNGPNKKWSDDEVERILQYMVEQEAFEKPTAQSYYKGLLEATGIQAEWNLIRWKVRNMRTSYLKALQLQDSARAGLLDSESYERKIAKMCPDFEKLDGIFGPKNIRRECLVESTDNEESYQECYSISRLSESNDMELKAEFEEETYEEERDLQDLKLEEEDASYYANTDDVFTGSIRKRKRDRPNRKWSDDEVEKILQYMLEQEAFEMPTAQCYYKKLIEATGIQAEWCLIRWKVRNMRTSYLKALQLKDTIKAGLLDHESCRNIELKISKMCPDFKKLHHIFGSKNSRKEFFVQSNDNDERSPDILSISRFSALQSERNDVQMKKLEFEMEKYEEEKELQERKLKLEEEKFQLEKERQAKVIDIEEKKLRLLEESKKEEFKLRQEELAMRERIARYELELKYLT